MLKFSTFKFFGAVLFGSMIFAGSQASAGVGHGGGGEWNVIRCSTEVSPNQTLALNVCLTGDTNAEGKYEIIPCGDDTAAQVSIERITRISRDTEMRELVKMPAGLFTVDLQETSFSLSMRDRRAGEISLLQTGTYDAPAATTLKINLPSMKHDLSNVSCVFGSN